MNDDVLKKKVELLVEYFYNNYDFLRVESLDDFKNSIFDKYLNSGLSFDEIQEKLEEEVINRRKNEDTNINDIPNINEEDEISNNHRNVYEKLEELAYLLRLANVNYYIEGGLVGYLKYNEESNRKHRNINITVNEDDYDNFKSICDTLGIEVVDNPTEEISNSDNQDIIINLSSFKKLEDGSIISKRYDNDGNIKQDTISSKLASIVYGNETAEYRGYNLNIILPEYIYYLKSNSLDEKDKIDIEFLKDKIDKSKLELIEEISKIEDNSNDLNSMIEDDEFAKDNEEVVNEKPKVFEKKDSKNNEDGFANTATISGMNIFAIILTIICIIIMYLAIK